MRCSECRHESPGCARFFNEFGAPKRAAEIEARLAASPSEQRSALEA